MPAARDPAEARRLHRQRVQARADGLLKGVLSQLRRGDLAIDCGANVGSITTQLAATGADVIAYEPDPVAFDALTTAMDGRANVTLMKAAVGIENGKASLFRGEGFDNNPVAASRRSTILPGANRVDQSDALDVSVVSLPEKLTKWVAERGEIAFLKLDIEGAELDILTEMLRLDLFDHVRITVAELHGYKFPTLKPEFQALRETLSKKFPPTRVFLDWI